MGLVNSTSVFESAGMGNFPQPMIAILGEAPQAQLCNTIENVWNVYRQGDVMGNCDENRCLVSFVVNLVAEYQRQNETQCAISMTSFDKKTITGSFDVHGDMASFQLKGKEAFLNAKSNFKDFLEANWQVPTTQKFVKYGYFGQLIIEEIVSKNDGNVKIAFDPNDANKINIQFENSNVKLSGTCQFDQENEVTCEAKEPSLYGRILGDRVVAKIKKEVIGDETVTRVELEKKSSLPLFPSTSMGSFEMRLNSITGEVRAQGKIDALVPGGLPLFDGKLSCTNNPDTKCSTDLKVALFETGSLELDMSHNMEITKDRFSVNMQDNILGEKLVSVEAQKTETETVNTYKANIQLGEIEAEGSVKVKKPVPRLTAGSPTAPAA